MTGRRASTASLAAAGVPRPAAASSEEVVDELYRGHALRLTRMALLLVGDQQSAEDVVQEAFLGLFRGLGRLSDPGRAGSVPAGLRAERLPFCAAGPQQGPAAPDGR
jgi:hypothetical protein